MRSFFLLPLLLVFSLPAFAESKTYKINVSSADYRNYILSGTDRNGSVTGNDPTITVNKGDTIIFNVDASHFLVILVLKMENYHGIQREYQQEYIIMFVLHMHLLEWGDPLLLNK